MTWLQNNWSWVVELTLQHLALAVPAIVASVALAVPLGRLAHRRPRLRQSVLGLASVLYAIPALPLLIVIPVVFGIPLRSPLTLVIALTLYGTALLVGTATDAFVAVDEGVRESARAMGYSRRAMFWRVDLPLSVPVLLSGIRVVTVSTVSLVTIGALVGISSLGTLLTDGFQRGITSEVVTGVVVTMALALLLDGTLLAVGRALTPWQGRRRSHTVTEEVAL
ncbi:ABC transporter permease subunit [Aeromicrobium sp. Marseille-Q0843]|uniref:ABC transporter permease subunit n=1 Tax=Aeromicrobium phoceense TaxID=2754045 RepID=A0A838XQ64_9ACTN|nr:ABC transporter permease subunit [Aeromicrobium phoceense]MBA4609123.1 ABC transporter permease subunit [Aeromicrobium phoceense]